MFTIGIWDWGLVIGDWWLIKINFNKLEILDLSDNNITDIKILEKVNFKELKELYLNYNNISDIKVLEKVKFEKLEELYLTGNEIDLAENNLIISKLKSLLKKLTIWIIKNNPLLFN